MFGTAADTRDFTNKFILLTSNNLYIYTNNYLMTDDVLIVSSKDLARTYNSRAYGDSWEFVEDYWRVMDYATRRPELGSQALTSRLDLPRSRICPWVRDPDGDQPPARPDAVRGIQTAESHSWIPVHYDTDAFPALNRAVAWIFSGGSIDTTWYVPLFTIGGDAMLDDLTTLLKQLGVGYSVSREIEGGTAQGRAAEYRPARDASVLGRLLALLGAPVGAKNTTASIELPAYLDDAPDSIREEFVAVYLRNRGTWHQDSRIIKFREERSKSYLRADGEWTFTNAISDEGDFDNGADADAEVVTGEEDVVITHDPSSSILLEGTYDFGTSEDGTA